MAEDTVLKPLFPTKYSEYQIIKQKSPLSELCLKYGTYKHLKINFTGNTQNLLYTCPSNSVFLIYNCQISMLKTAQTNDLAYVYLLNDPTNNIMMMISAANSGSSISEAEVYDPPVVLKTANATIHFGIESTGSTGRGAVKGFELPKAVYDDFILSITRE